MNLALVIGSLARGGAERTLVALAETFVEHGDTVTLFTVSREDSDEVDISASVHRVALGLDRHSTTLFGAVRSTLQRVFRLRGALRHANPDVVLSFLDQNNVLTLLATRGTRIPVVVSERVDPRHHDIGSRWDILRRRVYRWAAALVVQTAGAAEWAELVVGQDHVKVIPNFPLVDGPSSDEPYFETREMTVLGMGRLVHQKGFDTLLEAFAQVARSRPEWNLVIHGEGPERSTLEALAASSGISERIKLLGTTHQPMQAMQAAKIFVLASRYEGFPNVLLEAMALGCPVIATDCPSGPADLIEDGVNGLLVAVDDPADLEAALARLMDDPALRQQLGRRATDVGERFGRDRLVRRWREVLSAAAATRARSPRNPTP